MGLFGGKSKSGLPQLVSYYIINDMKRDAEWVGQLQAVVRPNGKSTEIRIYDKDQASDQGVNVTDYATLDKKRDLILYEGAFDEASNKVELKETLSVRENQDTVPFAFPEIWQKIAKLKPGESTFFYLIASPVKGGPGGAGAAIVDYNPSYPGPKQKKYILSFQNMDGKQLEGSKQKGFDFDKSKEVASWIVQRSQPPKRVKFGGAVT